LKMHLQSLEGIPLIQPGDDLGSIILISLQDTQLTLENGDILVVAQKIVSKAENRLVNLSQVTPTEKACQLAARTGKDARLVELILQESREILRVDHGLIIVEHQLGFVCANAGIDHSNVRGSWGEAQDWYLLLPENPDRSAQKLRDYFFQACGVKIGVLIIDSHGRAWRNGVVGTTIGLAGLPGVVDLRGKLDIYGYELRSTMVAAADELASAASLLMGQADERTPVVHVRGFPYALREAGLQELIRDKNRDLFR